MKWTDFFLYLSLLYVVYYAINVVLDVLRKPRLSVAKKGDTYSFQTDLTEFDERPTVVEDNDFESHKSERPVPSTIKKEEWINRDEDTEEIIIYDPSPVKSTGGVSTLNSLFVLAKEGTIEMKKKVVFS